jgi:hypothetical protein
MVSISLATAGWGVWWVGFLLWRLAPDHAPPAWLVYTISSSLALVGLGAAVLCVRAGLAWLLLTAIPLFANLSLLAMPVLLPRGGGLLGRLAGPAESGARLQCELPVRPGKNAPSSPSGA